MKKSRNQVLKERYHYYRSLGFSAKDANKYKHQSLNTEGFIVRHRVYQGEVQKEQYVVKNTKYWDARLDTYRRFKRKERNDTVYSRWGMLTQVEPHASESLRLANHIAKRDGYDIKYGYYYLYLMTTQNLTNEQVAEIAKTDPTFEIYKRKTQRQRPSKKKKMDLTKNKTFKNDDAILELERLEKEGY